MSPTEKTYVVQGMTCGHCETSLREEVQAVAGVASAKPDHNTGKLVVGGEDIDDEAVRAAVAGAGYRVIS